MSVKLLQPSQRQMSRAKTSMQLCKSALHFISATLTFVPSLCQPYQECWHQSQVCGACWHHMFCKDLMSGSLACCLHQQTCSKSALFADEEKPSAIRRRSAFKLLTDLLLVGVYSDAAVLLNAVKLLAALDFQRDRDAAQSSLTLFASFAKSCRQDVLGLPSSIVSDIAAEDASEASLLLKLLHFCSSACSLQLLSAHHQAICCSGSKQK